jgi:hypothetical protein
MEARDGPMEISLCLFWPELWIMILKSSRQQLGSGASMQKNE